MVNWQMWEEVAQWGLIFLLLGLEWGRRRQRTPPGGHIKPRVWEDPF